MPSESVDRHADSTKLRHHVWTLREFRDVRFPALEDFRASPFVRPDPKWSAKVIEHDRRIGKRSRELSQALHLRMVMPRIEAQTERLQSRKAFAKARRCVQVGRRIGVRVPDLGTRVETRRMPDAAKARRRRVDMSLQYFFDCTAQGQIREADDSRRDSSLSIASARALRRDT